MTGLDQKIIKNIIAIITNYQPVEEIILFGSRAKGTNKPSSDIDLALKGTFTNDLLLSIANDLENLYLPYKFDLVHLNKDLDEKLATHIARVGQTLFKRK